MLRSTASDTADDEEARLVRAGEGGRGSRRRRGDRVALEDGGGGTLSGGRMTSLGSADEDVAVEEGGGREKSGRGGTDTALGGQGRMTALVGLRRRCAFLGGDSCRMRGTWRTTACLTRLGGGGCATVGVSCWGSLRSGAAASEGPTGWTGRG